MTRPLLMTVCALALFAGAPATLLPTANAQTADFAALAKERAPAIVTIKFIMKSEQGEEEDETVGTLIAKDGLIITSNLAFGGMMAMMGQAAPTPTNMKVMIGEDTLGVDAKLIARDSELGLAWVRIEKPASEGYPFVDFATGTKAKLGDAVFSVQKLGKYFDRTPSIAEARIAAITTKPRELLIPTIGMAGGEMGLPVYNASGAPIGLSTLVLPEREEMEGGGMRSFMRGMSGGMILPAAQVVDATKRAIESAAAQPIAQPAEEAPKAPAGANEGAPAGDMAPKATPESPKPQ
jgi:S1-C subfamily serine protease